MEVYNAEKAGDMKMTSSGWPAPTVLRPAITKCGCVIPSWQVDGPFTVTTISAMGQLLSSLQDESGLRRKVIGLFPASPASRSNLCGCQRDQPSQGKPRGLITRWKFCDVARTMAHPGWRRFQPSELSADYYKGDRSMRESGFEYFPFRFRTYGAATHHFAPVCLNSLLTRRKKIWSRSAKCWVKPRKLNCGSNGRKTANKNQQVSLG